VGAELRGWKGVGGDGLGSERVRDGERGLQFNSARSASIDQHGETRISSFEPRCSLRQYLIAFTVSYLPYL
jgi:hypothetical protein